MQNLAKQTLALQALAILLAPTLICAQTLPPASSGTLDSSFGTGGKVTTGFAGSFDGASSVAVQPDGNIVVAGTTYINGGSDFALARYDSNGTLDASFGIGGQVITDFAGCWDGASSVAVQGDGKIVAAGFAGITLFSNFALARYEGDGALDTSFGTAGKVTTDFGLLDHGFSVAQAFSLAVQLDGKIVAGGRAFINGDFHSALARYDSFGTLDAGFGTSGKVTIIFGGSTDGVSSFAVQPDGKIVVAGGAVINEFGDFALARLN